MQHKTHAIPRVLALLILFGALAPVANAWPLGRFFHLHPSAEHKQTINVTFYNAGRSFQDVLVEGRTYTVKPHEYLTIEAQPGTGVFAASATLDYRRGDLMFALTPQMNNKTIPFK